MATFPSTFPCPQVSPFSMDLSAGLVRTAFENGMSRQRRRFKNLPHTMQLRWVLTQPELGKVIPWLNDHGYGWFDINLPSELAGQKNLSTVPHEVRLISDLACNLLMYDKEDASKCVWEVNCTVEWMKYSTTVTGAPDNIWIIARTAGNPSPDWVIARTPANPAPDWVLAGTPSNPSSH